jgi:hypothetical protein
MALDLSALFGAPPDYSNVCLVQQQTEQMRSNANQQGGLAL